MTRGGVEARLDAQMSPTRAEDARRSEHGKSGHEHVGSIYQNGHGNGHGSAAAAAAAAAAGQQATRLSEDARRSGPENGDACRAANRPKANGEHDGGRTAAIHPEAVQSAGKTEVEKDREESAE